MSGCIPTLNLEIVAKFYFRQILSEFKLIV